MTRESTVTHPTGRPWLRDDPVGVSREQPVPTTPVARLLSAAAARCFERPAIEEAFCAHPAIRDALVA